MAKMIRTELKGRWKAHQRMMLSKHGFAVEQLSQEQIDAILLPSEAPESYSGNGELNENEALNVWLDLLQSVGLTTEDIDRAKEMIV